MDLGPRTDPLQVYRVTLTLVPGENAGTLTASIRGPKPADLWIAADRLPCGSR